MDINKGADPRSKSNKYSKGGLAKLKDPDLEPTQFLIDDNYVGDPPHIQVGIDNLNDNINENFLRKDLSKLGKIRMLEIVRHPITKEHLGLAKVEFDNVLVAQNCVDTYHGKQMMGRQLNVFKDVRFALLQKIKEVKMNPKPVQAAKPQLIIPQTIAQPIIADQTTLHHQPNSHHPILPIHQLQKNNAIGAIPSPPSLEYPLTTPSSISSSVVTPEPSGRQRLEDRIANLLKQPNCVLSTIVAPSAQPAQSSYRALNPNQEPAYDYVASNYYRSQNSNAPFKQINRHRTESQDYRRADNNSHSNHYQNHKDPYAKHYDKKNNRSSRNSDDEDSDDAWNKIPDRKKEPLDIKLTEEDIEKIVLPHCQKLHKRELFNTLFTTVFKKLKESYGYQCIEKAQSAYRARVDEAKRKADQEKNDREIQRRLERIYMTKDRIERQSEAPRQRVNLIRQRTNDYSSLQDNRRRGPADLKRVNRSSAYVAEPERRGSHTSADSDYSDDESSSSDSSFSRASGYSKSSSSSSSRSSSSSSAVSSSSSSDDSDSDSMDEYEKMLKAKPARIATPDSSPRHDNTCETSMEAIAADVLLQLHRSDIKEETAPHVIETPAKKRKKKSTDVGGKTSIASEYRSAKKFASESTRVSHDDIENTMVDGENYQDDKPEPKFIFPERSESEKERMLNDLYQNLSDEDIQYLFKVHQEEGLKKNQDVEVPFGSENANKAHLNLRKQMIEGKAAEGHPKWWRGCSRCDVIEVSEKGKMEEETNYEDLTKAPIKSHVIQAANSSRRDNRGDQRRIAVLNADLDPELIKMYTTNTLQMRAKNLRFSRSKIHKWGLFACENIASGDAVIEYVGERIRPSLADHREKIVYTNLPTHDGSSYFFRVDYDVIDATLKGNKARFINHSCNPNCIAKVIKHDNGYNSIVIYAKQAIQEDEEITYDYKFPREENKILCNCKAPNCQKYLN